VFTGCKCKWHNVDYLNDVKRKVIRHFGVGDKEFLKAKIDEHEINIFEKNITDCIVASMALNWRPVTDVVLGMKCGLGSDTERFC
jgi:transcriptional accessory protein Tex/SPT6